MLTSGTSSPRETAPSLTSDERAQVARFVLALPEARRQMLFKARNDPRVSGCLVHVFEYLLTL